MCEYSTVICVRIKNTISCQMHPEGIDRQRTFLVINYSPMSANPGCSGNSWQSWQHTADSSILNHNLWTLHFCYSGPTGISWPFQVRQLQKAFRTSKRTPPQPESHCTLSSHRSWSYFRKTFLTTLPSYLIRRCLTFSLPRYLLEIQQHLCFFLYIILQIRQEIFNSLKN